MTSITTHNWVSTLCVPNNHREGMIIGKISINTDTSWPRAYRLLVYEPWYDTWREWFSCKVSLLFLSLSMTMTVNNWRARNHSGLTHKCLILPPNLEKCISWGVEISHFRQLGRTWCMIFWAFRAIPHTSSTLCCCTCTSMHSFINPCIHHILPALKLYIPAPHTWAIILWYRVPSVQCTLSNGCVSNRLTHDK